MSFEPTPELPLRKPPAEEAPRPKLSIAHLMLWTLGTAVVLALSRAQLSAFELPNWDLNQPDPTKPLGTYLRVAVVVTAPFTGMAVALMLVVAWKKYRRQAVPLREPGHWILLIGGVMFLLNGVAQLLQFAGLNLVANRSQSGALMLLILLPQLANYLAAAGLFFLAWRHTPGPPRWRFFFSSNLAMYIYVLVAAILMMCSFALGEFSLIFMLPLFIVAIPILIAWLISFPNAVIRDLWLKEYRDALHWAGVALVVVSVVAGVANMLVPYLLMRS